MNYPEPYVTEKFTVDGCDCILVIPPRPRPEKVWVWKAEFFTAFPSFEIEMLERGFYVAFQSVGNTFGCPSAMRHFDRFYEEMVERRHFDRYPVLLGLSRGGLYVYNWAFDNPDKVGCIYADNPVCDFKSWPGGKGIGPGSAGDWEKLRVDYGFSSEDEALRYQCNPVDRAEFFAHSGIPLVHAAGVDDEVVPIAENTDVMERNLRSAGLELKVFRHRGKHHPHGLLDPAPLADWIEAHRRH